MTGPTLTFCVLSWPPRGCGGTTRRVRSGPCAAEASRSTPGAAVERALQTTGLAALSASLTGLLDPNRRQAPGRTSPLMASRSQHSFSKRERERKKREKAALKRARKAAGGEPPAPGTAQGFPGDPPDPTTATAEGTPEQAERSSTDGDAAPGDGRVADGRVTDGGA